MFKGMDMLDAEGGDRDRIVTPTKRPLMPQSYLIWAILSTFLCCLPLGVVAIVYASRVENLYWNEMYDEALYASNKAKNWSIGAFIAGLGFYLLYFTFIIIVAFTGALAK